MNKPPQKMDVNRPQKSPAQPDPNEVGPLENEEDGIRYEQIRRERVRRMAQQALRTPGTK